MNHPHTVAKIEQPKYDSAGNGVGTQLRACLSRHSIPFFVVQHSVAPSVFGPTINSGATQLTLRQSSPLAIAIAFGTTHFISHDECKSI